jgi:hypothetical protein
VTTVLDTHAVVERFGSDLAVTIRRERRTAMTSPLFDLPGRSSLGFAVTYALAPEFIERLEPRLAPEVAGELMRRPLMRPYFLQFFILLEGYLSGREQLLLDNGGSFRDDAEATADLERTARVVAWVARACDAYRADSELFPGDTVFDQPILSVDEAAALANDTPLPDADEQRVRRALGTLELFAITLHGEQRDGIFDHGSYATGGRQLALHEVNDLSNDYLPWADEETQLGVDAVGAVRAWDAGVTLRFDLFGTMSPLAPGAGYRTCGLWQRSGDSLTPLSLDELEAIAAKAAAATTVLYRRMAAWEPEYRTRYGSPQFLNHLVPFARLAGAADIEAWLTEQGDRVAGEEMRNLRSGEPRSIWSHFATADRIYTPPGSPG